MKILNLIQGTEAWSKARLEHFTASEAPAMMGDSKYQSRNALLKLKKTGEAEPVGPAQQKLFDKGHAAEAAIRPHIETLIEDELYPVTGESDEHPELLASFDGLNLDGSIVFEHKLWNEALAENVRNGNLEPHYIWQLEQLILVSDAERAIFVCSDGTTENMAWVWYLPQPGLTDQLLAGWAQFKKDLDEFEAAPAVEVIEATVADLPVITASVSGTEISTNIQEVIAQVKEFAAAELARPLETDLDFANKESLVKKVKAARAALKNKVADIRSGFGSFEEFSSAAAEADKVLQQLQSASEKAVKSEKENRKKEIADKAMESFERYSDPQVDKINGEIGFFVVRPQLIKSEIESAIKGKRNLQSMRDACDDVVAKAKIEFDQNLATAKERWTVLQEAAGDYLTQIGDLGAIMQYEVDHIALHVKNRIDEIKAAEQARAEQAAAETGQAREQQPESAVDHLADQSSYMFDALKSMALPELTVEQEVVVAHLRQFDISKQAACRIAQALLNNEIPGITVTVNQSAA